MQLTRNTLETGPGPGDWFTGAVFIDTVAEPAGSSRIAAANVHFTPGARTAWHTHPLGQRLFVLFGRGLAQREGGPVEEIRAGDVVSFAPGEKHWHGASPEAAMQHIAVQEALNGKAVEWMEHVTDDQYHAATRL